MSIDTVTAEAPETGPAAEPKGLSAILDEVLDTTGIDDDEEERDEPESAEDDSEGASAAETADSPQGDDGEPVDDDGDEADGEQPEPYNPEAHWPGEVREAFKAVPPREAAAIGGYVKQLFDNWSNTSREAAGLRQFAEPIAQLFPPERMQQIAAAGLTVPQVIGHLLNLRDQHAADPKEYFRRALLQSGLTPQDLMPSDGEDDEFVDPEVQALRQRQEQLEQQIQQAQYQQAYTQASTQAQYLQSMVQQFEGATDKESGQPLYPWMKDPQFRQQVGHVLKADPQLANMPDSLDKLAQAYWKTAHLHPQYSQQLVDQRVRAEIEKKQKAEQAKLARRQKTVRASTPAKSAPVQNQPTRLDDILDAELDKYFN